MLTSCRECGREISDEAIACPHCGAPFPARDRWDGYGFEYKTKATLFGLPIIHVSFKYRPNFAPVPAVGIIAIGQFAIGGITISQFGIGILSVAQFTIAGLAVAQFAAGFDGIAQFGAFLANLLS